MATGIAKGEKRGNDAVSADLYAEEPFALPAGDAELTLTYPNKLAEEDILAPLTRPLVRVVRGYAVPASAKPNAVVIADNFFGMKALLPEYAGKVTLVYLDPPFATGMDFQSRSQQHAYGDKFAPATYIEFMRRRLVLMRELLSEDGSMYLHIGHQMLFHLKVVADEVFGSSSFRNLVVRRKCSSKNYTRNQYGNLHDYILFYTKTRKYKWNQPRIQAADDWIEREYPKDDRKGRYKLVPIHAPGARNGETGKEWRGRMPPPGKHWQYTPAKLDELDSKGEIHWSKNDNPRRKVYLSGDKARPLTDYWDGFRDAHHQSIEITGYPTEKNLDLLKTVVAAATDEGDLVLDPFCGSGTTLHAANDLNRRWIGIDESLPAIEATVKRLRHGLAPMGDYVAKKPAPVVDLFAHEAQRAVQAQTKRVTRARFDLIVDEQFYSAHQSDIDTVTSI